MTELNKQEFIALGILKSMLDNIERFYGDAESCLERAINMSKTMIKECNETQNEEETKT